MSTTSFDDLQQSLANQGPEAALELLCATLREKKEYGNLFYALLMKKRHELDVSPVPTEEAQSLPEPVQRAYEEGIREAGRLVGRLYLEEGNIPQAWMYFRMLGEPEPVAQALERYQFNEGEDCQPVIEIALQEGVLPRKGFDWFLERYGICSSITLVGSSTFPQPGLREYCIKGLIRALYEQVRQRLVEEIVRRVGTEPTATRLPELMAGRDWLFEDGFYHVDTSHLAAVVQMSIELTPCAELDLARDLCAYGQRLCSQLQHPGYPPFEDQYVDYGIYLDILAGERTEQGLAHFHAKADNADPQDAGTAPAEVLVKLLLRLNRPAEALAVARRHLVGKENSSSCPNVVELCRQANDYRTLAEIAREQGDPVHFMAGLLAAKRNGN
jgi:hypothetical protein